MSAILTTCPFCACGCGVYLRAKDAALVGVEPSEHHPVSQGRLCARAWCAHQASAWGNRLSRPLVRRNGALEPTSWREAVRQATNRLSALAAAKGVGVLGSAWATNEENYLTAKLARVALRSNSVDFCLRASCGPLLDGIGAVTGEVPPPLRLDEIEAADVVFLLEGDLARSHPRAASSVLRVLRSGGRLVTLGSVTTQLARLASAHFAVLPGRESEIMNGLLATVVGSDLQDPSVTAARCQGWEALRRDSASLDVPAPVVEAARWLAGAQRAAFLLAPTGLSTEQARANATAVAVLAKLTGHLDRPGSGLLPLLVRSNVQGALQSGVAPDRLPGWRPLDDSDAQNRLRVAWGARAAVGRGFDADVMLGKVGGLVVVDDDPTAILADGEHALSAMQNTECMVVLSAFDTATTQVADVVLPIASFGESEGSYTSMEGRVQRVRAAAKPPGDAREGWAVLAELIAELGGSGSYGSAADVFSELARLAPPYQGMSHRALDDEARFLSAASGTGTATVRLAETIELTSGEYPHVLARDGAFDWGSDPLIAGSPILCRDSLSQRKLRPAGVVEMARSDADELGVRHGWQIRLVSKHGEVTLPVAVRGDLNPGVLLLPFPCRDHARGVTAGQAVTAVRVERT